MILDLGISESMEKVTLIIEQEYPKILSKIAEDIFASGGKTHGRNWAPNKPTTIGKKGGNSPNIETGQLENWLTTDNNLLDDDYMAKLPPNKRTQFGYYRANELREFDNIGRTNNDKEYIVEQLAQKLAEKLS